MDYIFLVRFKPIEDGGCIFQIEVITPTQEDAVSKATQIIKRRELYNTHNLETIKVVGVVNYKQGYTFRCE
ncbi:hypothetical protein Q5O24_11955 [Eubacteriaceae bacterium ES3]|nr:hypothetical protein Q5O24_11955 [Eubacteriaceae bacterium ES3]